MYLVGTPIGNLGDITLRALAILQQVDIVLAEDTRTSLKLLDRYGISRTLESLHQQNEVVRARAIGERLREKKLAAAIISDAGTPLISDPGYPLVQVCYEAGVPVRYVPGASALLGALTISGMPCERFAFEGFLPARQGARVARLNELRLEARTVVCFEAPHRIRETLADMCAVFGAERPVAVVRELTKLHETVYRGTLGEVADAVGKDANATRGELVIVVAADERQSRDVELPRKLLAALSARLSQRDAVELVSEATGYPRNQLYALALELKKTVD